MSHLLFPVFLALLVSFIPAASLAHSVLEYPPPFDGTTTHINTKGICHGKMKASGPPTKVERQLALKFHVLNSHLGPCMVELRNPKNVAEDRILIAQKNDCVKVAKKRSQALWTIAIPKNVKPGEWVLRWTTTSTNTKKPSHFESCALISIPAQKPPSPKPADAASAEENGAHWGEFKKDKCSAVGKRQYSAILWDISGSWEEACKKTPANINGKHFAGPARCRNTASNMWGEFDVPDDSCP